MRAVITDDAETGFAGGYKWRGPDGLGNFVAARAGFVDEQHDIDELLEGEDLPSGEVRIKTRLEFSLRQPPRDELFTGTAFHTWLLLRDAAGRLRVAAQIVDGFANSMTTPTGYLHLMWASSGDRVPSSSCWPAADPRSRVRVDAHVHFYEYDPYPATGCWPVSIANNAAA